MPANYLSQAFAACGWVLLSYLPALQPSVFAGLYTFDLFSVVDGTLATSSVIDSFLQFDPDLVTDAPRPLA